MEREGAYANIGDPLSASQGHDAIQERRQVRPLSRHPSVTFHPLSGDTICGQNPM